ncbi:MAG: hypothetical protein D6722_10705 [Bacteroidetes bacterium]|nr:MAG: hypothetical protein D6722_10705 [Bacteroidota bacterium]
MACPGLFLVAVAWRGVRDPEGLVRSATKDGATATPEEPAGEGLLPQAGAGTPEKGASGLGMRFLFLFRHKKKH